MRANSAAIQPRLRTMPRVVAARCVSVHSGNASLKLNSAVLRSFGVTANKIRATATANARANRRGNAPVILRTIHTTANANHSFIAGHYARTGPVAQAILPAQRFQVSCKARSCRSPRERREQALSTTIDPAAQLAPGPIQRIGWAILIVATLYICYFSHLGVIGF